MLLAANSDASRCQTIFAVDRGELNKRLLSILDGMPNVTLYFNHKLTGADFRKCKAWFELQGREASTGRAREIEIDFDLMIGADGAHSAVRYHMMKFTRMDYRQEYIDTLWCEFQIPPQSQAPALATGPEVFKISPNHLHIWPGKDFMFIAIPSNVRVFPTKISLCFFVPTSVTTGALAKSRTTGRLLYLHSVRSRLRLRET